MDHQYTVSSIAETLGVHNDTIKRYEKNGILEIRRNKINNWRIITQEEMDDMTECLKKNNKWSYKDYDKRHKIK